MAQKEFPCPGCGAMLYFNPADQKLKCDHCGYEGEIPDSAAPIQELDYQAQLSQLADQAPAAEALMVHCSTCGAQTTFDPNVTAGRCPFCDSAIVAEPASVSLIQPRSLLPFEVTRDKARASYKTWLNSLWLAPNALKKQAHIQDRLKGVYVPFWTYDAQTASAYTGQRGDDYWVTQTHTVMVNGKPQVRTTQVRRTRWSYVSGHVSCSFDDILILASKALPPKYTDALEPWDLDHLKSYEPAYLSGFTAQSYQITLPQGFAIAQDKMDPVIHSRICDDIGGDHQRVSSVDTQYIDVKFKHLLLPIWLATYRYHEKVYRFLVNARTGEVQGERPWSKWKIAILAVTGLIVLGVVLMFILAAMTGGHGHVSYQFG
jgi:ribosomal protein S27E